MAGVTKRKALMLRRLVCALERSGLLYAVLSPDSDYVHRNHFHVAGLRAGQRPVRSRFAGRKYRPPHRRR